MEKLFSYFFNMHKKIYRTLMGVVLVDGSDVKSEKKFIQSTIRNYVVLAKLNKEVLLKKWSVKFKKVCPYNILPPPHRPHPVKSEDIRKLKQLHFLTSSPLAFFPLPLLQQNMVFKVMKLLLIWFLRVTGKYSKWFECT